MIGCSLAVIHSTLERLVNEWNVEHIMQQGRQVPLGSIETEISLTCYCNIMEEFCSVYRFKNLIKFGLSPFKKIRVICFVENPLKVMKNTFYFILKALFLLKIFKFL